MLKSKKSRVLAPEKESILEFSEFSLSAQASLFSVFSLFVMLGPLFALQMAKTAERAITCSVPRHTSN